MKLYVRKAALLLAVVGFLNGLVVAQQSAPIPQNLKQVKNVVIMIPDGTSTSVLSLARWYQSYNSDELVWLNLDEIVTGLVKTHSSDAPIGDSAPTGSTYATGVVSQAGYVSTYPEKTNQDIVPVDASLANTPAMTILEAAKIKGLGTGLVVTCDFAHATPADFSAHTPNRSDRKSIAHQMVHNNIDVVFAGGTSYLSKELREELARRSYDTIFNSYERFVNFDGRKAWALFAPSDIPYDIDRNPKEVPSLAQMTKKALETLSKNEKGFFLMVEGSKVDFAAHGNDAVAVASEFVAFDKAVKEVLDFAKKNGQTAIIICPDHGNSGINIGNASSNSGYYKLSKQELFEPLAKCKHTSEGLAAKLVKVGAYNKDAVCKLFSEFMGIDNLTYTELQTLKSPMTLKDAYKISGAVTGIVNARTFIGFTTMGHTGEDVFLACYHPQGQVLKGVVVNTDVNRYACELLNIGNLKDSTAKYFVGHKVLFPESEYDVKMENIAEKDKQPILSVTSKASKKAIRIPAYEDAVLLTSPKDKKGKEHPLKSVVVYVEKNKEFYVPRDLKDLLDAN